MLPFFSFWQKKSGGHKVRRPTYKRPVSLNWRLLISTVCAKKRALMNRLVIPRRWRKMVMGNGLCGAAESVSGLARKGGCLKM
jgi:hypothetical protein